MQTESLTAFDESLAGRIRDALARRRNIEEKRMFGSIGFLLNGNMLVGVRKDSLIARIRPEAYCRFPSSLKEDSVFRGSPSWFDERFFTILTGVVGVWCLFGVPQVSNLIGQWPLDPVERVLFGALVVLLALFYLITLIDMIRPLPPGWLTGWAGAVNGWLVESASRMQRFSTGSLGYVLPLAMMAGGLFLAWWIPFDVNRPYQLSGGVLKASALWITLCPLPRHQHNG